MSFATLKYYDITLSFLPVARNRRLTNRVRFLRLLTSRRKIKQLLRAFISH